MVRSGPPPSASEDQDVSDLEIAEMQVGLAHIRESPLDAGTIEMIAMRPDVDQREVVPAARIEPGRGVVGDSWSARRHPSTEAEVTLMNARCIALLAGTVDRWPLAGDQLYVDLDLSERNLPAGVPAPPGLGDRRDQRETPSWVQQVRGSLRGRRARVRELR